MPVRRPAARIVPMPTLTPSRTRADDVNALYDGGCELLFAAQQLQTAASRPGTAPAIAATVGCIDASLEALLQAISSMKRSAASELRGSTDDRSVDMIEREFHALADALRTAQGACDQLRERTGPLLAELTLA
jgi:hypothetical protein